MIRTVARALDDAAASAGAYTFVDRDGAEHDVPFPVLRDSARALGGALRARGLDRGDRVALVIPEAVGFLTTFLGASAAGLVPTPLVDPGHAGENVAYLEMVAPLLRAARARDRHDSFATPAPRPRGGVHRSQRPGAAPVHLGLDVPTQGGGPHPRQPRREHPRDRRAGGHRYQPRGRRRELAAPVSRYGPHRPRAVPPVLRLPWRLFVCGGVLEASRRVAPDHRSPSRYGQLRPELRLLDVRTTREGRRARRARPLVVARGRLRGRADPGRHARGLRREARPGRVQ